MRYLIVNVLSSISWNQASSCILSLGDSRMHVPNLSNIVSEKKIMDEVKCVGWSIIVIEYPVAVVFCI